MDKGGGLASALKTLLACSVRDSAGDDKDEDVGAVETSSEASGAASWTTAAAMLFVRPTCANTEVGLSNGPASERAGGLRLT